MPQGTCSIDGCNKPIKLVWRGWCGTHAARYQRLGTTDEPAPCGVEGCHRNEIVRSGLCTVHQPKTLPRRCSVGDCAQPAVGRGWCNAHYLRYRKYGSPDGAGYRQKAISRTSEARFLERLAELGATLLEDRWLGSNMKHRVICGNGHECDAVPNWIASGRQGICVTCAGLDPKVSEDWFLSRLAELGATPLDPYKTARLPVRSICAAGHECSPIPYSLKSHRGVCRICSERDPGEAHRKFIERVSAQGGKVLEEKWLGSSKNHKIVCANGHHHKVRPGNVAYFGLCKSCSMRHSTVFYVVGNEEQGSVKFGVTSGDGKNRLNLHRKAGYWSVLRLIEGFPDARTLENLVVSSLRDAGISPIKGREYFDVSALAVILDIVDNYPVASISA